MCVVAGLLPWSTCTALLTMSLLVLGGKEAADVGKEGFSGQLRSHSQRRLVISCTVQEGSTSVARRDQGASFQTAPA